jgi:hypothetical protein
MPFKSKKQQRFMFAKMPELAKEFAEKTNFSKLPEKAKKKNDCNDKIAKACEFADLYLKSALG